MGKQNCETFRASMQVKTSSAQIRTYEDLEKDEKFRSKYEQKPSDPSYMKMQEIEKNHPIRERSF